MRFFTEQWINGDDASDSVVQDYMQFIDDEGNGFSNGVKTAARNLRLHDGACISFEEKARSKRLVIEFAVPKGDGIDGYRLKYTGCHLSRKNKIVLQRLTTDARYVVLYDEFDVAESAWVHRLLLGVEEGMDGQLEIIFQSFEWEPFELKPSEIATRTVRSG